MGCKGVNGLVVNDAVLSTVAVGARVQSRHMSLFFPTPKIKYWIGFAIEFLPKKYQQYLGPFFI